MMEKCLSLWYSIFTIENLGIYRSKGLPSHIVKRKHYRCLKYIDYIPDIILKPDYIGINPNEQGKSIELIKRYADNDWD